MGRALEPFLTAYSGMSVVISNVTAGNGAQAIQLLTQARKTKPVMGLINLASLTTPEVLNVTKGEFTLLTGLGVMSTDHSVWLSREPIDWLKSRSRVFVAAASSTPYARLSMPGDLLGVNIKPVFGYEGSSDVWMALMRDEIDLMPSSDDSAKRYLSMGGKAEVTLALTMQPHPDFPAVPYLAGRDSVLDVQSRQLPSKARQRLLELGELVVMLSESTRTLVVSPNLGREMHTCLKTATQAALFDPELASVVNRQRLTLSPMDSRATDAKIRRLESTFKKYNAELQSYIAKANAER